MITVGITEMHGIAAEYAKFPPDGVSYDSLMPQKKWTNSIITSTAKGVLNYFESEKIDLIEAPLFPILTPNKWIYTPADFPTCLNFSILGVPLPRSLRIKIMKQVFLKDNFIKLIFKSFAGKKTLIDHGKIDDERILQKVDVVYPAVRHIEDKFINFNEKHVNILFSGDLFSKGGVHVVDAFERLQNKFKNINLRICSSENLNTKNKELAKEYLNKINNNRNIKFGFVTRDTLFDEILPASDIFVCPTYKDSYGYAIEEAMSFGIPVISTNHFAIPEMVINNESGFLIDTNQFKYIRNFKDYSVSKIPLTFHKYMNNEVYKYLEILIADKQLRIKMGHSGLEIARTKFSFKTRNKKMKAIYEEALIN